MSVNNTDSFEKKTQMPPQDQSKEKIDNSALQEKQQRGSKSDTEKQQHAKKSSISLSEDTFGTIFDENGYPKAVKRFIWKNHNNIEVHLITYGARIVSIKLPDRKGELADIVMGFDDLAGYIYYEDHYFGATLGRVTSYIENATCKINGRQKWFTPNKTPHHYNGGHKGFDKVIWNHHIEGTKVILTHLSSDKDEGYPGDLLVKISYELTAKNEFNIDMEAVTTKPTIVNLSMMNYFNLAGHNAGPEEMYKHMMVINANCYTVLDERGLPKGEIQNVSFTKNDFQVPVVLEKVLNESDEDGFDQNLCINRGSEQENAFVARMLHVPSGRSLEVYSNQYGVQLYTADRLGLGLVDIPVKETQAEAAKIEQVGSPFDLVAKLHDKIKDVLEEDKNNQYSELRNLIRKLQNVVTTETSSDEGQGEHSNTSASLKDLKLSPFQLKYLDKMKDITDKVESVTDYSKIGTIVNKILQATNEFSGEMEGVEAFLENTRTSIEKAEESAVQEDFVAQHVLETVKSFEEEEKKNNEALNNKKKNSIPPQYADGRIHGKQGCIYKKHGAVVLQTQNYPNAIYHKKFPNSVLNPGEIYHHTIVYKFYRQAGNPNKWIKQYNHDLKRKCVNVVKKSI